MSTGQSNPGWFSVPPLKGATELGFYSILEIIVFINKKAKKKHQLNSQCVPNCEIHGLSY